MPSQMQVKVMMYNILRAPFVGKFMTLFLTATLMFALSLTIYDVIAILENCQNFDLENESQGLKEWDLRHSTGNVRICFDDFFTQAEKTHTHTHSERETVVLTINKSHIYPTMSSGRPQSDVRCVLQLQIEQKKKKNRTKLHYTCSKWATFNRPATIGL